MIKVANKAESIPVDKKRHKGTSLLSLFFNELSHVNTIEVLLHRGFWSFILLFLILISISNINEFISIFKSRKKIFILTITACLISSNWGLFIFAVGQERVQDASMGYFITPMISIVLGYLFLKEKITLLKLFSIVLMIAKHHNLNLQRQSLRL